MTTAPDDARLTEALSKIDDRVREIRQEEARANAILERCLNEIRSLEADRKSITDGYAALQRVLGRSGSPTSPVPSFVAPTEKVAPVQARARVGDKRYVMLTTVRDHGPMTMEHIAGVTRLDIRRIRDQMRQDAEVGVVEIREGLPGVQPMVYLCPAGLDLLSRFESYRASAGKPLPRVEDLTPDEDDDGDKEGNLTAFD